MPETVSECQAMQVRPEVEGLELCAILESSWRRVVVRP